MIVEFAFALLVGAVVGFFIGRRGSEGSDEKHSTEVVSVKALEPLFNEIKNIRSKADNIHETELQDHARLEEAIKWIKEETRHMRDSADGLKYALRGDHNAQGAWGEVILESILEKSGLRPGEEYEVQASIEGETGRPDAIVYLPGDRKLIIDSKASYSKYLESQEEALDEVTRERILNEHAKGVRAQVTELAKKEYGSSSNKSGHIVFMFIPLEAAFVAALTHDRDLFSYASDKGVIMCSPTTLMPVMKMVQNVWSVDKQNRNIQKIVALSEKLYAKFSTFVRHMENTGKALDRANDSHSKAMLALQTGRGSLADRCNKLMEYGAHISPDKVVQVEETFSDSEEGKE